MAESDKDLLRGAYIALETIRHNLGIASFIDSAEGCGMAHIGYCGWVEDVKRSLGLSEAAVVHKGHIVDKTEGNPEAK